MKVFIISQQDKSKKLIRANFSFSGDVKRYIKEYLGGIDAQSSEKFDLLKNKIQSSSYVNNLLESKGLEKLKIRHTKISDDIFSVEEVQERNWQNFNRKLYCEN